MGNYFSWETFSTPSIFSIGCVFGVFIGYNIYKLNKPKESKEIEYIDDGGDKNYRMILGVRTDLKMQKGKVAAQCAHAAVAAYIASSKRAPDLLRKWKKFGQAKITVKIDSEEEMLDLDRKAREMGILSCIIQDAGHTQVAPNTRTVIAFGPAGKSVIDNLTGHLKLY